MNEHQQVLFVFFNFIYLHSGLKFQGKKPKFLYELLFYPCLDEADRKKYMIHSRKVLNSHWIPSQPSLVNAPAEDALFHKYLPENIVYHAGFLLAALCLSFVLRFESPDEPVSLSDS